MLVNYLFKNQIRLLILSSMAISIFAGCGSVTPQVPAQAVAKKEETRKGLEVDKEITKKPVLVDQKKSRTNSKNIIIKRVTLSTKKISHSLLNKSLFGLGLKHKSISKCLFLSLIHI